MLDGSDAVIPSGAAGWLLPVPLPWQLTAPVTWKHAAQPWFEFLFLAAGLEGNPVPFLCTES